MADDELNDNCVRYRNHANCTFFFSLLSNILMVHKLEMNYAIDYKTQNSTRRRDADDWIALHFTGIILKYSLFVDRMHTVPVMDVKNKRLSSQLPFEHINLLRVWFPDKPHQFVWHTNSKRLFVKFVRIA